MANIIRALLGIIAVGFLLLWLVFDVPSITTVWKYLSNIIFLFISFE